ncbi:MAG: sporulation transcriptional regulator SpoIIID [Acutalibacteraceae bacterium]
MKQSVDDRAAMLGEYIVQNKATVRRAAKQFGVSKSTVHKDVAERLRHVNLGLYKEVRDVLAVNKAQRHIRGGMATKRKYEHKNLRSARGAPVKSTPYVSFGVS